MIRRTKDQIRVERIEILKKTIIFSDTEEEVLITIADALVEKIVRKEKIIFRKGDVGNAMYIIVKGSVRVHDGNHVLSRMSAGNVFGEYSLIDEETRSATVTAEEESKLLKLSQEDFYNLIFQKQAVTKGVLKVLIKRMRKMNVLEEKLAKSYIKIRNQKDEIEEQHINISEQKTQLEEQNFDLLALNEEKNHLISILVHGLKNPLTSSSTLIDLLISEEEKICDSHKEYVHIIQNSLKRINNRINQILDVSSIESKTIRLRLEKIDLSNLIMKSVDNFKFAVKHKQLSFQLNLDRACSKLNSVYSNQIIDNLISNAVKFAPISSTITINLLATDCKTRLEVIDQGPGISKEDINGIFDKYQRQTKAGIEDPLDGLGLSIVKKYTNAMAGKVWCESNLGNGSKFIVEFNKLIEN